MDERIPKRKRRWFRLSLRAIFVLLTTVCVLLSWKVNPAQQQREAVTSIRKAGGALAYNYEEVRGDLLFNKPTGEPPGPAWLRDLIGLDFFADVIQVDCERRKLTDFGVLAKLPRLERLNLNETGVRNLMPLANLKRLHTLECRDTKVDRVSALKGLADLQYLQLSFTPISDVSPLSKLAGLEQLYLHGTQVHDVSPLENLKSLQYLGLRATRVKEVTPLAKLKNLKWLDIRDTPATDEDLQVLRRALPKCNIEYSTPPSSTAPTH